MSDLRTDLTLCTVFNHDIIRDENKLFIKAAMNAETEVHIKTDVMSALRAFAFEDAEKLKNWNGFAIYCMQIAAGFIYHYTKVMASPPQGIQAKKLAALADLRKLSYADIKNFVDGTTQHEDIVLLFDHLNIERIAEKKNQEIKTQQQEFEKHKSHLQNRIDGLQKQVDWQKKRHEMDKNSFIKQTEETWTTVNTINETMKELKKSQTKFSDNESVVMKQLTDISMNTEKVANSLLEKLSLFMSDPSIKSDTTKLEAFVDEVKQLFKTFQFSAIENERQIFLNNTLENTQLKIDIDELKEKFLSLTEKNKELEKKLSETNELHAPSIVISTDTSNCFKHITRIIDQTYATQKVTFDTDYPSFDAYQTLDFISNDFSGSDDFAQSLIKIMQFSRSALSVIQVAIKMKEEGFISLYETTKKEEYSKMIGTQLNFMLQLLSGYDTPDVQKVCESYFKDKQNKYKLDLTTPPELVFERPNDDVFNIRMVINTDPLQKIGKEIKSILHFEIAHNSQRDMLQYVFLVHLLKLLCIIMVSQESSSQIPFKIASHFFYLTATMKTFYPFFKTEEVTNPDNEYDQFFENFKKCSQSVMPLSLFHQGFFVPFPQEALFSKQNFDYIICSSKNASKTSKKQSLYFTELKNYMDIMSTMDSTDALDTNNIQDMKDEILQIF